MADTLKWGFIGLGSRAQNFAPLFLKSKTASLVAVASQTPDKAKAFAEKHHIERYYGSYDELLAQKDIDVVYIALINSLHATWAIRAAQAGKHILCEKPLALNHPEATAIIQAAMDHDVFLMEAMMYRCSPLIAKLRELLSSHAIGKISNIHAKFGITTDYNPEKRIFKNEIGGGAILDVGCYTMSLVRMIAGYGIDQPFAEPKIVQGMGKVVETGVDQSAVACLEFPNQIFATMQISFSAKLDVYCEIYGSEGSIVILNPFKIGNATLRVQNYKSNEIREYPFNSDDIFLQEIETVAKYIEERQAPQMSWTDSLGNMQALDTWREALSIQLKAEKFEHQILPLHGRPLAKRPNIKVAYGKIPGLNKDVSKLIVGATAKRTMPATSYLFDDFFEYGGNAFDTAHTYQNSEKILGWWIKNRNVREQVVIVDKGAFHNYPDKLLKVNTCTPKILKENLAESLERLQTDYIDVYMVHKDNLEVPVGEFMDLLNEFKAKGLIKTFGVANWTTARIDEANAYAKKNNKEPIQVISSQFSLAEYQAQAGDASFSDAKSREWLTANKIPLLAWSSQARGFFSERGRSTNPAEQAVIKLYNQPENYQRLDRAEHLAKLKNTTAVAISLAYVLSQPFPIFALIGPKTIAEWRSTMKAAEITLTPAECAYLNLEKETLE
jgi:predicted dehydrogenase/aryl-alcohol dehydrogenase-like predicted oxidoreductase